MMPCSLILRNGGRRIASSGLAPAPPVLLPLTSPARSAVELASPNGAIVSHPPPPAAAPAVLPSKDDDRMETDEKRSEASNAATETEEQDADDDAGAEADESDDEDEGTVYAHAAHFKR